MKQYLFILLSVFFICPSGLRAHKDGHTNSRSIEFIANEGQWDGPFVYKAITGGADIFLEKKGFTYVVGAADNREKRMAIKYGKQQAPASLNFHAYRVHFEGAQDAVISGSKPQTHYYNYFLGNKPERWKTGIHPVQVLDYKNIYQHIDLRVASEGGSLKYDFIVHPGADAGQIRLRFEGTDGISIHNGGLHISTSVGYVEERKPYAYQLINGQKKEVRCVYKIKGSEVTYVFPQGYDRTQLLVIDPVVEFATFTGSVSDNWGYSATYDNQGNFYAGGGAAGPNYPITTGAFQLAYAGGGAGGGNTGFPSDMAISKFNPSGSALVFSTFIGGQDNDQPHSMIVDANNNLIIAGRTYSNNYPTHQSSYDTTYNGNADIVVTKLNATGTALIGSTFIGGTADDGVNISSVSNVTGVQLKHSYADDARSEVIVDKSGRVYVTAASKSTNFPLLQASQSSLSGTQDAVVFKLSRNLDTLLWSTYLGGSDVDAGYVLALDTSEEHVYVAGGTASGDFPVIAGGYWATYQGGISDGYIVKFQNDGTYPKMRSTFIGRGNYDQCFGIQVDLEDNVYVTGNTLGGTFPVQPSGIYADPGSSQFVMKLNPDLNNNIYSTVFGTGNTSAINITPVAFLVDTCQNVYISGWGGNLAGAGSSTTGLPVTLAPNPNPAFQSTTDGEDFYFFVLSKNAVSQLFGSFFGGGTLQEHVDGGTSRFDKNGVIYQAICGGCWGSSAVPTTPGAYSTTNGSALCNLVAVKVAFNLGAVNAVADAEPKARGCLPFTVEFSNNSTNAVGFTWDFDDGSPVDTNRAPTHTFTQQGTFNVRMVAYNPNACKVWDTVYLAVRVDTNRMTADFEYAIVDSCDPYSASFVNTSHFSYKTADALTQFDWYFGDGNSFTGETPPVHNYAGPGTYTVMLVINDTTACNDPDTVIKTIEFINQMVRAAMDLPDSICIAHDTVFNDLSQNATSILWDFGDGTTSAESNPRHRFPASGRYTVTLAAMNPATCNGIDSIQKTIWVKPMPVALFEHQPQIPQTNMPISFVNLSKNAVRYHWDLGDGTESREQHTRHLYKRTGKFKVCLTVYTPENCSDVFCREVETDIRPLIDVPSAFSPNGDGNNDILYVRGGAVETIVFRIYNRWGEMVFESTDMNVGWDGTYKGKGQEMEVYAYTLYATFFDGSATTKQGNVTLLR